MLFYLYFFFNTLLVAFLPLSIGYAIHRRYEKCYAFHQMMNEKCCAYFNQNREAIWAGEMPNPIEEVYRYLPSVNHLFFNPLEIELYIDPRDLQKFGWLTDKTSSHAFDALNSPIPQPVVE